MSARLFIVTAPSGAGKTSILKEVLKRVQRLQVSVSHTTRPMRPSDRDGIDYHFVDKPKFQQLIAADAFFEYAQVFDNFYGTSKQAVNEILQSGTDVLLEIDWQGAEQVRQQITDACSVFILPPSLQVLRQRLTSRATDTADVIERRMQDAVADMRHFRSSDFVMVNDNFDRAVSQLCAVIEARRLRLDYQRERNATLLAELTDQSEA